MHTGDKRRGKGKWYRSNENRAQIIIAHDAGRMHIESTCRAIVKLGVKRIV